MKLNPGEEYTKDELRDEKNKQQTHEGLKKYKELFFKSLNERTLLMLVFTSLIYIVKIIFLVLVGLLLLSYVLPQGISLFFDRKELQDFILKIIAGGFFNQLLTNTFGKKDQD